LPAGKPVRHHATCRFVLDNGRILRIRISRRVDRTTFSSSIWNYILQDQLMVGAEEFRACVEDGVLPVRGIAPVPESALPLGLVWNGAVTEPATNRTVMQDSLSARRVDGCARRRR